MLSVAVKVVIGIVREEEVDATTKAVTIGGSEGSGVKLAVSVVLPETVMVRGLLMEETVPDQLAKVEVELGVAVRVIWVFGEMFDCEQTEPQFMEPPVTVPELVGDFVTVRV